ERHRGRRLDGGLEALRGAEHLSGVDLHQIFEAEVRERLRRRRHRQHDRARHSARRTCEREGSSHWGLAMMSSRELICSPARLADSRWIRKRSCPCSKKNCVMPPADAKPSMLLIVSTGDPPSSATTSATCVTGSPDTYKTRQARFGAPG